MKKRSGAVVEVMEIGPGVFAAALFRRAMGLRGPFMAYVRHAGGGSVKAALRNLDAPYNVTVVQNLHEPIFTNRGQDAAIQD